jgi:hypothetical protein
MVSYILGKKGNSLEFSNDSDNNFNLKKRLTVPEKLLKMEKGFMLKQEKRASFLLKSIIVLCFLIQG